MAGIYIFNHLTFKSFFTFAIVGVKSYCFVLVSNLESKDFNRVVRLVAADSASASAAMILFVSLTPTPASMSALRHSVRRKKKIDARKSCVYDLFSAFI